MNGYSVFVSISIFRGLSKTYRNKFHFPTKCCILLLMNQKQPNLLPLYLITLGSGLLAIPGALGTYFLIFATIDSFTKKFDSRVLLLPFAVIGYFLLFGYVWIALSKEFVKWFWLISMVFNLLITLAIGFFILTSIYRFFFSLDSLHSLIGFYLLFPIWTIFVTIASAKYAFLKPTTEDLHLP